MNKVDYHMLYENIVLGAWACIDRRSDPLALGDADTIGMVDNELSGDAGRDVKIGLCAALKKVSKDQMGNDEVYEDLIDLYNQTWNAEAFKDICTVLDDTKQLFNGIGIIII